MAKPRNPIMAKSLNYGKEGEQMSKYNITIILQLRYLNITVTNFRKTRHLNVGQANGAAVTL